MSKKCFLVWLTVFWFFFYILQVKKYLKLIVLSSDEPRNAKKKRERNDLIQSYRSDFCVRKVIYICSFCTGSDNLP